MQPKHYNTYPRINPHSLRNEFKDKAVLITGGNGGIGAEVAKSFAEAQAKSIILVGRNESKLDATAKTLQAYKATTSIETRVADISSPASVRGLFESLSSSPDVLVNNAGYLSTPAKFLDADLDEFWKSFQINVFGTILITQTYLHHRQANAPTNAQPAVVINLNTIGAYSVLLPGVSAYASSKAAQARWSELAQEEIPESTARIISIHPGSVVTDMYYKSELESYVKGPITDISLAADFIVWATSEEARFLAGRFLHVNWDVDQLVGAKKEILDKDLFRTSLTE